MDLLEGHCGFLINNMDGKGKFHVSIFIRNVSSRWALYRGTWRTLTVPDQRHGGQNQI